jgi:HSP20 family protein
MTGLVRWGPGRLLEELGPDRPGLFSPWWGPELARWLSASRGPESFAPACDIAARGEELVLRVDLPGIDPERDVEVAAEDGVLYIRGERHRAQRGEDEQSRWAESWTGTFERGFQLPGTANPSKITASYRDGVLEVVVPQAASPGARKIPVTVAGRPRPAGNAAA